MTTPAQQGLIARLRARITRTHQHAEQVHQVFDKHPGPKNARLLAALKHLNDRRRAQIAVLQGHVSDKPTRMFDTVTVETVPADAKAVAGYVGGHWPTYQGLVKRFPHARHLSIAISVSEDAECLDVEPGDATPDQVVAWVRRQHVRGIRRPCLYAARLNGMAEVQANLQAAGIPRDRYRLWVADYTGHPHLPAGFDACQWTSTSLGRNLDESVIRPNFFD